MGITGTSDILFTIGPVGITRTVVTTWGIIVLLAVLARLVTRRLRVEPDRLQTAVEGVVNALANGVGTVTPEHENRLLPFIGTLWIFLVVSNLAGLVPGLDSPTADLSATAALAVLVFGSVHWYGIQIRGLKGYLRHYLVPNPILLPFHVIGEITRTVALAVRLFGNMMSLQMAALLILMVAGFLVPVPILMLHVVEALVQAYIFGMLALVYIAGALEAQELRSEEDTEMSR